MCLWCNEKGKRFSSVYAAQQHMLDKGHCKMLHEGNKSAVIITIIVILLQETRCWSMMSGMTTPPATLTRTRLMKRLTSTLWMTVDTSWSCPVAPRLVTGLFRGKIYISFYSLLSNNRFHLLRYYKQSLNPNRALVLVDKRRHNLLTTYKSLGWTGSHGQAAVTKARDLSFMRRIQNKQSLSLGMRGNNQKHFKDRNGMCM